MWSNDEKSREEMRTENDDKEHNQKKRLNDITMEEQFSAGPHASTVFSSEYTFSNIPGLLNNTRRALTGILKFSYLSKVQAATMPYILKGDDVLAKAETGSGKTIAFLVPTIDSIARRKLDDFHAGKQPDGRISCLVLSPTRELAIQIYNQARILLKTHTEQGARLRAMVMYGGTKTSIEQRSLREMKNLDIVVATPGRLIDHLQNTRGFADRLSGLTHFILDEADRLLDMGFQDDLKEITTWLPRPHQVGDGARSGRQTLLFSATVPPNLVKIAPEVMAAKFVFIDANQGKAIVATAERSGAGKQNMKSGRDSGDENSAVRQLVADDPLSSASSVDQTYLTYAFNEQAAALKATLDAEMARAASTKGSNYKIMVFFPTARMTQVMSEVFMTLRYRVLEMHSRKTQAYRKKNTERFRDGKNTIMFSSDVTARGMDFPDVSLVVQVGLPSSAEQYVHRLGRTGRAGKRGRGILILDQSEQVRFIKKLNELPLKAGEPFPAKELEQAQDQVKEAYLHVPYESKEQAYAAWLGYYNGNLKVLDWDQRRLVAEANKFAKTMGLDEPPALSPGIIGRMGLKASYGLRVQQGDSRAGREGSAQRGSRNTHTGNRREFLRNDGDWERQDGRGAAGRDGRGRSQLDGRVENRDGGGSRYRGGGDEGGSAWFGRGRGGGGGSRGNRFGGGGRGGSRFGGGGRGGGRFGGGDGRDRGGGRGGGGARRGQERASGSADQRYFEALSLTDKVAGTQTGSLMRTRDMWHDAVGAPNSVSSNLVVAFALVAAPVGLAVLSMFAKRKKRIQN